MHSLTLLLPLLLPFPRQIPLPMSLVEASGVEHPGSRLMAEGEQGEKCAKGAYSRKSRCEQAGRSSEGQPCS